MQQSKSPENIPEKEDKKASEERTENKDTETAVHSNDNEKNDLSIFQTSFPTSFLKGCS